MRILFLDVASHAGVIACMDDKKILAQTAVDHRIDDSQLAGLLEQTVAQAGSAFADLTHLACVAGPGGFTSLRVGVAAINALSYALKIPVCGIHLSDLYAARSPEKDCVWLHSTKKTALFVRGFGGLIQKFPEPICITLEELDLPSGVLWTGELIPEHQEVLKKFNPKPLDLLPLEKVLPEFLGKQPYEKKTVEPWYGRGW